MKCSPIKQHPLRCLCHKRNKTSWLFWALLHNYVMLFFYPELTCVPMGLMLHNLREDNMAREMMYTSLKNIMQCSVENTYDWKKTIKSFLVWKKIKGIFGLFPKGKGCLHLFVSSKNKQDVLWSGKDRAVLIFTALLFSLVFGIPLQVISKYTGMTF